MSETSGVLAAQEGTLLALVERHRADRCAALLAQAEARRAVLLTQAHREARARMREAIRAERRRGEDRLAATRAQLQTRRRQQQHRTALLLLEQGWERLVQAVLARWQSAPERHLWVAALLHQARERLPRGAWVIEHPPGWDGAECAELLAPLEAHCGGAPQLRADARLLAGLRIRAEEACLDGSLDGLLADRAAIEAQLLAQLHRLLNVATPP